MPIIKIEMLPGRTAAQKAKLVEEMTASFTRICGGSADTVQVLLKEIPDENWGIGGRLLADAMDVGQIPALLRGRPFKKGRPRQKTD